MKLPMTRRRCLWLGLPLLLAAVLMVPGVHWRLIGWVKGEAFYKGRPTSWWSWEALKVPINPFTQRRVVFYPTESYELYDPDLLTRLEQRLSTWTRNSPAVVEFLQPTQDALPVLVELLHDPKPKVRLIAAEALGQLGWMAEPAIGTLLALCQDDEKAVQRAAIQALHRIDPESVTKVHRQ